MRLACSTASFPADRLEIAIAKVNWAEYRSVELALAEGALPAEEELRERLRANDLELAATHAGVAPAEGEAALEEWARIGRVAALTRALDGAVIVLQAPEAGELGPLARGLKLLDTALGDTAVDVCIVNHHSSLVPDVAAYRELKRLANVARLRFALDPEQALLHGWDPTRLDTLPEVPRHVYLTDARDGRPVPFSEGTLDVSALGDALRAVNYEGHVSLLLRNADPWEVEPRVKELREHALVWLECTD